MGARYRWLNVWRRTVKQILKLFTRKLSKVAIQHPLILFYFWQKQVLITSLCHGSQSSLLSHAANNCKVLLVCPFDCRVGDLLCCEKCACSSYVLYVLSVARMRDIAACFQWTNKSSVWISLSVHLSPAIVFKRIWVCWIPGKLREVYVSL